MLKFLILFSFLYADAYEKFLERERSINTFAASFLETVYSSTTKTTSQIAGVVYFKKPGLFRVDVSTPYPLTFLSDGTFYYYINHELKNAVKGTGKSISRLLGEYNIYRLFDLKLSTPEYINEVSDGYEFVYDGEYNLRILLTHEFDVKNMRLSMDGLSVNLDIRSSKINPALRDSVFKFNIKGYTLTELYE